MEYQSINQSINQSTFYYRLFKKLIKKLFKKLGFFSLFALALCSIYSCNPVDPNVDPNKPSTNVDPNKPPISSNITIVNNEYVVLLSEDTTNNVTASIDLNIMDFYSIDENYDSNDVFVSYEGGVDVALVNTNNLNVDLDNFTISGDISLPQALDFEAPIDADSNNIYEIATFAITNVDGGSNSFALRVMITNSYFLSLHSESATSNVTIYTSNIIADLNELVSSNNDIVYTYQLSGADASYFELEGNILKTSNNNGFRSVYENDGQYNVVVNFLASGDTAATFSLTVQVNAIWSEITNSAPWSARIIFKSVVLGNGDVLVMGGFNGSQLNDIWRSSDGGNSWSQIPASSYWSARRQFQSVVLGNGDVLVMGGNDGGSYLNDIWRSSDGGTNWSQIPASNHWGIRSEF